MWDHPVPLGWLQNLEHQQGAGIEEAFMSRCAPSRLAAVARGHSSLPSRHTDLSCEHHRDPISNMGLKVIARHSFSGIQMVV